MNVGEDDAASRPHDASDFRYWLPKVGEMGQRQRADREVHSVGRQGQGRQVTRLESGCGRLGLRDLQHFGRAVDADDLVAEGRQVCGVPPRSAGRVKRNADRISGHQPSHDGLLSHHHGIAGSVVFGGPRSILGSHRPLLRLPGFGPGCLVNVVGDLRDAARPAPDGCGVDPVIAENRNPLQSKYEVAQSAVLSHDPCLQSAITPFPYDVRGLRPL